MKVAYLILLCLYICQPLACYSYPCESYLHENSGTVDTSGQTGEHSHGHDSDNCDSSACCAECVAVDSIVEIVYAPFVTVMASIERLRLLPEVFLSIFIPPQNFV
ncbi:MAG: hypothetical protein WCP10_14925 [Desulfuromonadales bacterium]